MRLYLTDLEAIDRSQLSRSNQVDALLLQNSLEEELWRLEELQEWAWNPLYYVDKSGGSIYSLLPNLIEAGYDIINPVQTNCLNMEPEKLVEEFAGDIVFWGGGVDTQKTIAFGTPDEVYDEVRQRIAIFNKDGGFVFNSIHNIQGNTPTENVVALFDAIRGSTP